MGFVDGIFGWFCKTYRQPRGCSLETGGKKKEEAEVKVRKTGVWISN